MSDYTIELDQYERDNLLAVLEAIAHENGPQRTMSNGDWNMQVLDKLGWQGKATEWGRPNESHHSLAAKCRNDRCLECELPQQKIV